MASIKYLVTVDAETSTVTKLWRMDEGGALEPIDISKLRLDLGTAAGAGIVINIYAGGPSVSPTGGKITDGEAFAISLPASKPPGRAR
jgi:hypothetical protein